MKIALLTTALPLVAARPVDPTDWLRECVPPYQREDFLAGQNSRELANWSNYWQLEAPHGLCADALACAFEYCEWPNSASAALQDVDLSTATFDEVAASLPPLNLPAEVMFPKSVAGLARLVKGAAARGVGVSIKTSGHSYVGSHTAKDSVQANLRDFPKYSRHSIAVCDTIAADASAAPAACKLALARNKTAVVRVGGGELWDDLYRSVIDWNTR